MTTLSDVGFMDIHGALFGLGGFILTASGRLLCWDDFNGLWLEC